jgi:hypothetical protein
VDKSDRPVKRVLSLIVDLVDINRIVMRTHSQIFLVRRVDHDLTPLSRFVECRKSFRQIVIVKDMDITIVVAHSDMLVFWRKRDSSRLLLDRERAHGRGGGLDLIGLVSFAAHHIE